jgi:protein-tyrosine kinase
MISKTGGRMSKIYQALEKAEKEREKEREFKVNLPPPPGLEEGWKKPEIHREPEMGKPTIPVSQLISLFQQNSVASEQFRKLRAKLIRLKSPDSPRTIMITSASNGEGKTLVAANLAAGIANDLHTQALLVDCDLRNPSLSDWFDFPKSRGISDYLVGNGVLQEFIFKTGLEKLSVIPAGSFQENPTELIGSKKMDALVQELRSQQGNRYIIFDSTPVLATTEPEVLGRLVDGIVFVVRAGVTPRETIQQALRSLEREKIIGVVLNDVVFKSSALHSRYFGSDGYYYRYGYGKKKQDDHRKWWQKLVRKT